MVLVRHYGYGAMHVTIKTKHAMVSGFYLSFFAYLPVHTLNVLNLISDITDYLYLKKFQNKL